MLEPTTCTYRYSHSKSSCSYKDSVDLLVAMMRKLSLSSGYINQNYGEISASSAPAASASSSRPCLRSSDDSRPRKRKSAAFSEVTSERCYSLRHGSAAGIQDAKGDLHPPGYVSNFTKDTAVLKVTNKYAMLSRGDVSTCVTRLRVGNPRTQHLSAKTIIDSTRRQLSWIQHKAIGNFHRPLSPRMARRVNEAATLIDRGIKQWMRDGEIEGARLTSCLSVRNKENLGSLVELFEQFVNARNESDSAWIKCREEAVHLKRNFTISTSK